MCLTLTLKTADLSSAGQQLWLFISSKPVVPHQKQTFCQTSAERTVERFNSCCGLCCRRLLVVLMATDSAGVLIYHHRFTDCAVCQADVRRSVNARLHLDIVTPLIASASLMQNQQGSDFPDFIHTYTIYLLPECYVWCLVWSHLHMVSFRWLD